MDNQHKLINGYRDLTKEEIALMNEIKQTGAKLGELIERMQAMPATLQDGTSPDGEPIAIDKRWLAIGNTQVQQGLMAVIRSVAKPASYC